MPPQAHVCSVSHAAEGKQHPAPPREQHRYVCVLHISYGTQWLNVLVSHCTYRFSCQGSSSGGYYAAQGDDPRRNVLSLGCRIAGPQATSELLSVQGVACTFPNTTVNVIRSPPWELLLSRIGDDLMFSLLRQHAVLQRLPNRCYMQASVSLYVTYWQ